VDIAIFDFATRLTHYPYIVEKGVRYPDEPVPIESSPTSQRIIETKAPLLIGDVPAWEEELGETSLVIHGQPPLSVLPALVIVGVEVGGRISLEILDGRNAFSEIDVRLLARVAGSLGVALENARLVHETGQGNAGLALINGVRAGIAGEFEPQAIYD